MSKIPAYVYEQYDKFIKDAESCDDCVSREAVLDIIKEVCFSKEQKWVDFRVSHGSNGQRDLIINFIESLPPVTPKQKTDVLDEIRSYIEESVKINQNLNIDRARALCWCLNVIDFCSEKNEDTATKEKSCATCGQPLDDAERCILFKEGKCVQRYEKWIPAMKEGESK